MQQKQGTLEPAGPLDSGPHPFRPSDERHKTVCQDPPRGPGPSGALKGRSTYGTRQHPEPPPDPGPAWTPAPLASISRPRPTTLGAKVKPCRGPEVRSREKDPCNPLCITVPQGARCLSSSPTSEPSRTQHSPHSPRSPQTCASNHQPSPPTLPPPRSGPGPGPQPDNKTPGGSTPAGETNDFRCVVLLLFTIIICIHYFFEIISSFLVLKKRKVSLFICLFTCWFRCCLSVFLLSILFT